MNPQNSLEKRLAYRFSILSTLNVRSIAGVYTKRYGLTAAGWRILSIIGRYEPVFPGMAAQLSTMDADKVTRAVDRLVDLGYVIRNTDAADRRRVILCLTSSGRAVYEEVEELSQQLDARWRSTLSKQENATLDALMEKLDVAAHELFGRGVEASIVPVPAQRGASAKRTTAAKRPPVAKHAPATKRAAAGAKGKAKAARLA